MPFVAGTPESLEASLQRRDSKDFSSTCRGINQNGTPCRTKISGKTSALKTTIDGKEAYFCWRHKEQAAALIQKKSKQWDGPGRKGSMDFLVEKVVAMAVTDDVTPGGSSSTTAVATASTTVTTVPSPATPPSWTGFLFPSTPDTPPTIPPVPPASNPKHKFISFMVNLFNPAEKKRTEESEDEGNDSPSPLAPAAPQYQPQQQQQYYEPTIKEFLKMKILNKVREVRFDTTPLGPPLPQMVPEAAQQQPIQPALSSPRKSKTQIPGYMTRRKLESLIKESKTAIIPPHLTPATRKTLHETLSKPFSNSDTPGYIYIFALLPTSQNRPTMPTASTIDPNDPAAQTAPRVLLKIGRTVNVASRLNQHANQCNYDPTLIRYYPHADSKSVASGAAVIHKVPNVNRIERLIHLELRDDPKVYPDELRHKCAVCRKIHKEWFSVEATEEGVKWVDALISRWIAWGEYWGGDGEGAKRTADEEAAALRRGEKIATAEEEETDDDEEEEIVITGKVKTKTPPRVRKADNTSSASPSRSPRKTPKAKAADRPPPPPRAEGHRSVERAKPKSTPKKSPASVTTPKKERSKSGTPRSPAQKKKLTVDITDDEEEYEDSDASYHDAETGEDDYDDDEEEEDEEEEEDGEEWVNEGKVETKSPNWKKGTRGTRAGKSKVKAKPRTKA